MVVVDPLHVLPVDRDTEILDRRIVAPDVGRYHPCTTETATDGLWTALFLWLNTTRRCGTCWLATSGTPDTGSLARATFRRRKGSCATSDRTSRFSTGCSRAHPG